MAFSVGIDLGTTNTVVSTARRGSNSDIVVTTELIDQLVGDDFESESSPLLPSVLYVDREGKHNVGIYAKKMKGQVINRVIFNSKSYIGQNNYKWMIDDKEYTPVITASYFLSMVRNHLMDKYNDEESIESAVITVPASFNLDQRSSTEAAAKLAGFKGKVTLISEPTAAVLDFINEQSKFADSDKAVDLSDFKKIAVFDLGGGTCDVSILKIKVEGKKAYVEESAVSPHTLIGGSNFDAYAVQGMIKDYERENKISLKDVLSHDELVMLNNKLNVRVEKAKIAFAGKIFQYISNGKSVEEAEKEISIPIKINNAVNDEPFSCILTMERYNQYINSLLDEEASENVISPITSTLSSNNLSIDDIDYVFCVGGMTKYPKVNETIKKYFNKEPLKLVDSMHAVSRGAAIYHYYDIEQIQSKPTGDEVPGPKTISIIPKLPQTIFLNVKNGFPIPLIEANTKAGTPVIHENLIEVTSEIGVSLEIYSGMKFSDPQLKKLQNLKLDFPFGIELGSKISLKLEYTEAGLLFFEAWVAGREDIKIEASIEGLNLDESEVEKINKEYGIGDVKGLL
ncbi:MAG: Hsp70 family protein [Clostridium sp.]|nr:Hsp70 family protein [Clostridium sp.]